MAEAGVPTAMAMVATNADEAAAALDTFGAPYVVKDDGLAAGKGVVVTNNRDEALAHAQTCFDAGGTVVIEEFLDGPKFPSLSSATAATPWHCPRRRISNASSTTTKAQHRRHGCLHAAGMGPAGLVQEVIDRVAQPTVNEMANRGTPFVGVLFVGLALTTRGTRVIEFNVRFGDPETQAVLARLKTPLGALLLAAAKGELDKADELRWSKETAVAVVVASENYPDSPRTGDRIRGLKKVDELDGVHVIHAGTAFDDDGKVISAGGRVLAVVALGSDLVEARERAYDGVELVQLEGSQFRTDIGRKAARGEIKVASGATGALPVTKAKA
ncbi:phosphoribosylamine--glycine ligase [Arthrobacter sp. Hiyo4]|nr:phosphoribosylamine--glycine ligase [Arthrobacter sp. Hiyo4]